MQVALNQPDLAKFVVELVEGGRFPSPGAVIEAGIARLMLDRAPEASGSDAAEELETAESLASIERAEAEFDRGEDRPFKEVAAEFRKEFRER